MSTKPRTEDLRAALSAAGSAHHDYERNFLDGVRDEQWAGWYAAYVIGRLGDFISPTQLTKWLEEVPADGDWAQGAATFVAEMLATP